MKEKIKISLKTFNNNIKYPNFRISCDNNLLTEHHNWTKHTYEETFELELDKGKHKIRIEHFGKDPKDTIVNENLDVAIMLEDLSFNGVKCNKVDLHENYFYTGKWRYPVGKKIKNSLYFGYNGTYEYIFNTPSITYILEQNKRYQKYTNEVNDLEITEDDFITKLESHMLAISNYID